ncbi:MAG: 1-acyl-sn-glycerol-3-phosphate acyltransferase [Tannerella sp.]|jgi:1-acyl-sn-glycerol-3-phosphate acyltransferase|nr:1-acyl-sn-glycerol-3-phosphate acyltransferase [Tannerella sp.]
MISFENVSKRSIRYTLLYHYVRFVHNYIYYRHYYVLHKERIPKGVPVVAISNHQNGLSDALGILFAFSEDGRYPVFIARADIFRKEFVAKLLRFIRIMPAFRAVDVGKDNLGDNDAIFDRSARVLTENGVVALFPEAGHQDCHHLGTFKKGFARIAFRAAQMLDFKKPIYIMPMSNHYSDYFTVRHKLIITCGEPFTFEDLYDLYLQHPQRAQKILADRARVKVQAMMLDIKDLNYYEEYDIIRTIGGKELVRKERKEVSYFPNLMDADRRVVEAIDNLRDTAPDQFDRLMKTAHTYFRLLEKLHLDDWIFEQKLSWGGFLGRCLLAVLLLPFIVFGFINNFIPFNASTLVTRHIKDQMLHSSFHFGIWALISFPLWYMITFFVVWFVVGIWWIALLYVALLPISLVIYIHSKIIVKKQFNRMRRFRFAFRGDRFYRQAIAMRREISEAVRQLLTSQQQ